MEQEKTIREDEVPPSTWSWIMSDLAYDNAKTVLEAVSQNPDKKISKSANVVLKEVKRLIADHMTSKPQSIIDAERGK